MNLKINCNLAEHTRYLCWAGCPSITDGQPTQHRHGTSRVVTSDWCERPRGTRLWVPNKGSGAFPLFFVFLWVLYFFCVFMSFLLLFLCVFKSFVFFWRFYEFCIFFFYFINFYLFFWCFLVFILYLFIDIDFLHKIYYSGKWNIFEQVTNAWSKIVIKTFVIEFRAIN